MMTPIRPRTALVLGALSALALPLASCEETSGSSSGDGSQALDNLSDDPQSLLGRSAKQAKDLRDTIEQRDAATSGLADRIAGVEGVEVGGLRWSIPEGWEAVEPTSDMRAAELRVPNPLGESVVTFSTAGGSVEQNVQRWSRQVIDSITGDPVRARPETRQIAGLTVHTVEFSGTYLDGPPMGRQVERPYHTLRGAIVEAPSGLVFVKMWGAEDAMDQAARAWESLLSSMTAP